MSQPVVRFGRVVLFVAIGVFLNAPALAQRQKQQSPRVELSGTVKKVTRGRIYLEAESVRITPAPKENAAKQPEKKGGTPFVIAVVPQTTTVRVSGTATAKFLRPRQYVRFSGKVDEKGDILGEIGAVEVFIPGNEDKPAFSIRAPVPKFASDAPPKKTRDFNAQGVVLGYRRGKLSVKVGEKQTVSVPVPEEAEVRFTVTSYAAVKPGDKVTSASGRLYRPGQVIGEQLNISLAREESKTAKEKGKKAPGTEKPEGAKPPAEKSP